MNTQSSQIQLKISLSEKLNNLLESKASRVGIPTTQFVKFLILKEVEDINYPCFEVSEEVEKNTKKALRQVSKAVDASEFFKTLEK